jgi:glycosyltransferase involved in cell wall biosynthesis
MTVDPKISVLMAVRDGERWLGQAIESVLTQTFSDFELVVVDDGSIDGSSDILSSLSGRDARIRIMHQRSEGLVKALNRALAVARGPLVARLDADDVALPERLARQAACFDELAALVLLGTWAEEIDDEGCCIGQIRPETYPARLKEILRRQNPFVHSSVMMRTSLARRLGGYREAFLGAEDFDLWLRMSECGMVANLPQALVRYRLHGGNTGRSLGVRQIFSVRLAHAASAAREISGVDPSDQLLRPPNWWDPDVQAQFYGEAAQICRFLEMADPELLRTNPPGEFRLPSLRQILELSHDEKKCARRAMLNLLAAKRRPAGTSLCRLAIMILVLLVGRPAYRSLGMRS